MSTRQNQFKDKVAIVTGGASGIGKGLAFELARRGARVIVADIDLHEAEKTVGAISKMGFAAVPVGLDVAKPDDIRKVVDDTVTAWGRLDYMFNNAGITFGGRLEDLKPEHWKSIMDINLWGVIHGSTCAYQVMLKQGSGHIINVASLAGLVPSLGVTYTTTKFGVVGFSQSLRMEAMSRGIKVSVVCPGFVRTAIYEKTVNVSDADHLEKARQWLATAKMASIEDCAIEIIRGVAGNKGVIAVTPFARNTWRLYRLFPELFVNMFARKTQSKYAKFFTFIRKCLSR